MWRVVQARPDFLGLHQLDRSRYPFLLESVAHGNANARFDILFAFPQTTLVPNAGELSGRPGADVSFLDSLDQAWRAERIEAGTSEGGARDIAPFRGGWFLFFGYELAAQIERRLHLPGSMDGLPVATAVRIPAALIHDHARGETRIIAEVGYEHTLDAIEADIRRAPVRSKEAELIVKDSLTEDDPVDYLDAVARIKRYIVEGDVFQVNLSRAWQARLKAGVQVADVYARLRQTNPAPFAGLADFGQAAIVSSSPERLVRVSGRDVETRPIAGTRPRGSGQSADQKLSRELMAHPKERAEHIMLIDLERNDLGRVCVPGSVTVDELMVLESYTHVHHIVSNVRGVLKEGATPGAVVGAVFPGGTITGCPKVRCMEIIAELERVGRGAYTGSMGYLNRDGSMDLNILIRTLTVDGQAIGLRAGAGIVADSIPEKELEETRAKARGLLAALAHGRG
ncbi:MAG: hypothetical protein AMJ69_10615 [Gammaproteobacteria bacterium SG8_47]|nr:MAG: hypothetical protein AMJ69_10615 [Gammaproteobacteria bacterium SG8_47]